MTVPCENNTSNELAALFKTLISIEEGIDPAIITTDWIHKQREIRLYPTTRYRPRFPGQFSLTQEEFKEIEEALDRMLATL